LVITYHGSDINELKGNLISVFPRLKSHWNIFVSYKLQEKAFFKIKKKSSIIPCGVDFDAFVPMDQKVARDKLGIKGDKKIVLFSSSFDNRIKNYFLAKQAVENLNEKVQFLEIKNRTRKEVAMILNAADLLLLTSFSEGSPQIIKEAMACNCPIVATDVGDIRDVISDTAGCYITSFDYSEVASRINDALRFGQRTNGREKIQRFDNKLIASDIFDVYKKVYKSYYGKE
jgi:glycosyltransferase involved in cell wall biosynthesis